MNNINNPINDNVFDSRDLIEYLEQVKQTILDKWNEHEDNEDQQIEEIEEIEEYEEQNIVSHKDIEAHEELKIFCDELKEYAPDFEYGETIIAEDYFTEYTEELLKDLGYISNDFPSWIEIDYEGTASNVQVDYTEVKYQGDSYWIR